MKKSLLSGVAVAALSAALCACGGGKTAETGAQETATSGAAAESIGEGSSAASNSLSEKPAPGGKVVFGMTQDLASLDPHEDTDAGTRDVVFNLYEGLVKPSSTGEMIPAVASDYEISDDAKTYTFTLRDGIKFSDGTPVTTDDVKYSLERYAENQGDSSAFSNIADISAKDGKIVLTLKEANAELLPLMDVAIIPQKNQDPVKNPIGTGPFKMESYTPGEGICLTRNENYWQEGLPYLDEVDFKFVPDVETEFMDLQAGTIDIMKYMTSDQIETLGADSNYNIVEGSMNLVQGLYLSSSYEPLSKPEVRQALSYAIDRDAINQFLFNGKSKVIGTHMIPAMSSLYNKDCDGVYTHDVEKAKELLKAAGYENGFDLTITVPNSYQQHIDTATIIKEQFAEIGVNVTLNPVEWSDWLQNTYRGGNFQATVIGFDGTLAPASWLKKYTTNASNNFVHYSNSEYDETYAKASASVDQAEKTELYKKCQKILTDDAASVYIQDPANLVAVNKKFAGYTFYPTSAEDMSVLYQVSK
ncbi:ABC transporter substrate-binding protein [[Clostridium] aminophilum]|uniref:ABC transporter substrate-binding protein n=1 Tax=[Clostridium] aminophilum TaxID=1526 RepID=UPI00331C018B